MARNLAQCLWVGNQSRHGIENRWFGVEQIVSTAAGRYRIKPLLQRNILRDDLNPILAKLNLKQNGKGFHSFRRFRVMHLRKNRVPWDLEKFWIGHASKDVTDKYAAQLKEDVEWRKDVAEKTGLGFALPASIEISIGQLGQPEVFRSEEAKAA